MTRKDPLIQIKDLIWWFDDSPSLVFDKMNMEIYEWNFYIIQGKHWTWKSLLANMLIGKTKVHPKMIYHNMNDIAKFSNENWKEYRRNISMISHNDDLVSTLSVKENIIYPLDIVWLDIWEIEKRREEIKEMLNLNKIKDNKVNQLSLAEKYMVLVARALIKKPEIVISDSILENIDKWLAKKLIDILIKMHQSWTTILFFTYDQHIWEYISGKTTTQTIIL